jgi:addiction module HigA family antidote
MECNMFKNGMRPVHPGEVLLEDYIKPMGVSVRAVAMALHVPYSRLSEITKGQRGVSADTALRLERFFGSEAKGWLNLQAAYELRVAEIENGKAIAREIQPIALQACQKPRVTVGAEDSFASMPTRLPSASTTRSSSAPAAVR